MMRAMGRAVQWLNGRYITAEDVGSSVEDMDEVARSTAEQVAVAMSSHAASARHACNAAQADHESAEQFLAEKLRGCGITREEAESAIARGETWIATEQARLDALRGAVSTARATLTERQRSAQEHEAVGRPAHTRDEIAAALADIEARRAQASADFIAASSALHNDDQARDRQAGDATTDHGVPP